MLVLQVDQEFFSPQSATVTAQVSILANDPVARNHYGDAIVTVGSADGSLRSRTSDGARLLLVADGFPVWYLEEPLPGCQLKSGSRQDERSGEALQPTEKVVIELLSQPRGVFVVSWHHGTAEPFAEADELRPEKRAVFKLKETDTVFRCSSEHRPDRGQKLRDDNLRRGFAARRAITIGERPVHFPD